MLDLGKDSRMRSFFVVKNAGAAAGSSVAHAVSQIIALAVVPPALKEKLQAAQEFFERHKRSVFDDIASEELRVGRFVSFTRTAECWFFARMPPALRSRR